MTDFQKRGYGLVCGGLLALGLGVMGAYSPLAGLFLLVLSYRLVYQISSYFFKKNQIFQAATKAFNPLFIMVVFFMVVGANWVDIRFPDLPRHIALGDLEQRVAFLMVQDSLKDYVVTLPEGNLSWEEIKAAIEADPGLQTLKCGCGNGSSLMSWNWPSPIRVMPKPQTRTEF